MVSRTTRKSTISYLLIIMAQSVQSVHCIQCLENIVIIVKMRNVKHRNQKDEALKLFTLQSSQNTNFHLQKSFIVLIHLLVL